jgi:hypothetical protein
MLTMRLLDLDPRWTGLYAIRSENRFVIGLSFLCPHCRKERLAIQFKPPIDPDGLLEQMAIPPWNMTRHIWDRTGETFETLTLQPSVDASRVGHWHGFITNGQIVGGIR